MCFLYTFCPKKTYFIGLPGEERHSGAVRTVVAHFEWEKWARGGGKGRRVHVRIEEQVIFIYFTDLYVVIMYCVYIFKQ